MKILDAKVEWYEGYANDPRLEILVDSYPKLDEMRFEHYKDLGIYYAEKDGYVTFFAYFKPGRGFGGSTFHVTLLDGTVEALIGPWSSRSGVMNKYLGKDCMEVSITDDPEVFQKGHTFYGGAITVSKAEEALKFLPNVKIVRKTEFEEEIYYYPERS